MFVRNTWLRVLVPVTVRRSGGMSDGSIHGGLPAILCDYYCYLGDSKGRRGNDHTCEEGLSRQLTRVQLTCPVTASRGVVTREQSPRAVGAD